MKQPFRARNRELAKLPPLSAIVRGTLIRYHLTCGNRKCRCHREKRYRHGPYWYVTVSYGKGKRKRYLLPAQQVAKARQAIAAYDRLWRGLCRISEINLALLKAGARRLDEPKRTRK